MARYIDIEFTNEQVTARALLLDDQAPKTCQRIWEILPLRGRVTHARYSGTMVAHHFDNSVVIEAENHTTYIQTGDVIYTHYAAGWRHGNPDALSEVYWAYDRYARPTIPGVGTPSTANVFGTFIGDPTPFYKVCESMLIEGAKQIEIRRVEEEG